MNNLFNLKRKELFKKFRSATAILLALLLVTSGGPLQVYAAEDNMSDAEAYGSTLTQEQIEALEELRAFNRSSGLIGFEGAYVLPNDNSMVNVIVYFEEETAAIQVIEASMEGASLSMLEAEAIVEDSHASFKRELAQLFDGPRGRAAGTYQFNQIFRFVLNGVAMTLPANMVEAVSELPMVRAIYPDVEIMMYEMVDFEYLINQFVEDEYYYEYAEYDVEHEEDYYVEENEPFMFATGAARVYYGENNIIVTLTEGTFAEDLTVTNWTVDGLGYVREVTRVSDTQAYVVVTYSAEYEGIYTITAYADEFAEGYYGFAVPLAVSVYVSTEALAGPVTGMAAISATRRTITINLLSGEFAEILEPVHFTIDGADASALGSILSVTRINATEARLVVAQHAVYGSIYTITANDYAFAGDFTNFAAPIYVTVFRAPYAGHDSGRYRMNADELHARGIDGTGVIVAIVDSGIDWMHPAFRDTFPTAAQMAARGVTIHSDELVNLGSDSNPDWRFVGRDLTRTRAPGVVNPIGGVGQATPTIAQTWMGNPTHLPTHWPEGHEMAGTVRPGHDPMETAPFNFLPGFRVPSSTTLMPPDHLSPAQFTGLDPHRWGWSNHGTHVHGSVNSQAAETHGDVGLRDFDVTSVGVAPGAFGVHYRVSWQGSSQQGTMLAGYEWAIRDGADVITMSIGGAFQGIDGSLALSYTRLALSFPYVVLVTSAGNNGPQYLTQGTPGQAVGMTSVAAFAEPALGVYLQSAYGNIVDGTVVFMTPPTRDAMVEGQIPGRVTMASSLVVTDIANTDTGNFKVFGLPITSASAGVGTQAVPVGSGLAPDFDALIDIQGRTALDISLDIPASELTQQQRDDIIEEGRAAIAGHFALVRRGSGLVDISANAWQAGMAGIIQITGAGQAFASSGFRSVPMFSMVHVEGRQFAESIMAPANPADRHGTFYFSETIAPIPGPFVADFSSRGHTMQMYDIKPEIGAHGVAVLSTIPRWTARLPWQEPGTADTTQWQQHWRDPDNFIGSYGYSQGTSMSAPHVAGGFALMVQYSRENGHNWTAEEMRARATITAGHLEWYSLPDQLHWDYSVFAGARQFDVLAAVSATTVVLVNQDHFPHAQGIHFRSQPHIRDMQVGHFAFGGIGVGDGRTMTATLRSQFGGTYYLAHEFIGNSRMSVPASHRGTFSHPATITVSAGESVNFDATINIPANAPTDFHASGATTVNPIPGQPPRAAGAWAGNIYHDGHLIVRRGGPSGEIIARVPFGAVALPRAVGTATATSHNVITLTSGNIGPLPGLGNTAGFSPPFAPAVDVQNLNNNIFTFDGDDAADLGEIVSVVRTNDTTITITISGAVRPGGNYTIHATNAAFGDTWVPSIASGTGWTANNARVQAVATYAAPLAIDTDGIETLSLRAFNNGTDAEVPTMAGTIRIWPQLNGASTLITMNAVITAVDQDGQNAMEFVTRNRQWTDAGGWQNYYINFDVTKDAPWETILFSVTAYGQTVTVLLINDWFSAPVFGLNVFNNGPGGSPSTPNASLAAAGTIRIWTQLDGVNALVPYADLQVAAEFPNGSDAMEFVRVNNMWANPGNVNLIDVDKSGGAWQTIILTVTLNGQEIELLLVNALFTAPVLRLQAFNNGNNNNASLAQARLIRIWTQLDGANALVPYADLTVTATLPNGACAMEFVRINRIWNNPGYVNLIDVSTNGAWQNINLSVTLSGQTVNLALININ